MCGLPHSISHRRQPGDPVDGVAALGAGLVRADLTDTCALDIEPELLLQRAGDGAADGVVLPAGGRGNLLDCRAPSGRLSSSIVSAPFVQAAYRLLAPGSEWRLHRQWFERSALAELLGAAAGLAEIHKLRRCHDRLLAHKPALFLVGRWRDLFNARKGYGLNEKYCPRAVCLARIPNRVVAGCPGLRNR